MGDARISPATPWRSSAPATLIATGHQICSGNTRRRARFGRVNWHGAVFAGDAPISGATPWRVIGAADIDESGSQDLLWQLP